MLNDIGGTDLLLLVGLLLGLYVFRDVRLVRRNENVLLRHRSHRPRRARAAAAGMEDLPARQLRHRHGGKPISGNAHVAILDLPSVPLLLEGPVSPERGAERAIALARLEGGLPEPDERVVIARRVDQMKLERVGVNKCVLNFGASAETIITSVGMAARRSFSGKRHVTP